MLPFYSNYNEGFGMKKLTAAWAEGKEGEGEAGGDGGDE